MKSNSIFSTAWKALRIIYKLYPIAIEIYEQYKGRSLSDKRRKPITDIKNAANAQGIVIGNTEAELVRSAIHYAAAKEGRQ